MNERGSSASRLLWKESRQLLPLMLILLGVGITLIVLWSGFFLPHSGPLLAVDGQFLPLLLPALFAAGAAAVLVGQEKEQGTLTWLTALPVPPVRVITLKFLAALCGLATMWIACWLLMFLVGLADSGSRNVASANSYQFVDLIFLHLNSVFVLLCGFYASWRIKNTFISLLAIIPLATIPFAVTGIFYVIRERSTGLRFVEPGIATATSFTVMFLSMALIGWLGYRAAIRQLGPAEPPRAEKRGSADWMAGWRVGTAAPARVAPFQLSLSSLVWQALHHNRLALSGIVTMILLGVFGLTLLPEILLKNNDFIVLGSTLAVSLGVSFLGVFTFTGDGSGAKLRYLAERGISPTRVWLGRQLVGVGVLAALLLVYSLISARGSVAGRGLSMYLPSVAMVTLATAVVYSVSQWASQLIRSLAASAFLAPAISFTVVWWLGFAAIELDAPLWLIALTGSLPMVATWIAMPRFMEGTRRWRIYVIGGITACLIVLAPGIPVAIELAGIPRISPSDRSELVALANRLASVKGSRSPLTVTLVELPEGDRLTADQRSIEETLALLQQGSLRPSDRLSLPANDELPWSIDQYALQQALASATYEKLRFQMNPSGDAEIESLGQWIESLTTIARRVRQSQRWADQQSAEQIEIWLTQCLANDAARALESRDFYQDALALITDSAARNEARRRAVLASWQQTLLTGNDDAAGNFLSNLKSEHDTMSPTKYLLLRRRINEAIIGASLRMIAAGEQGRSTEPMRRQLHDLIVGSRIDFEDGPYSDRLRVDAKSKPSSPIHRMLMHPASQWFAPWERDAESLANRPSTSDVTNQSTGDSP